jgi:hypothetical protein
MGEELVAMSTREFDRLEILRRVVERLQGKAMYVATQLD